MQWPGVSAVTAEEEVAAASGFQQAAGSSSGLVELWLGGREFAVSGCVGEGSYARVFQVGAVQIAEHAPGCRC